MRIDRIREALYAQPFKPFKIHLADGGRIIPVEHLDFVALTHGGREIVVVLPDDSMQVLDVMLITRLEMDSADKTGEALSSFREDHSSKPVNERIRELRNAQPFRPFRIHLANGDRLLVERGEAVAVSPNGRQIVVMLGHHAHRTVDVASITRLEIQSEGESEKKR